MKKIEKNQYCKSQFGSSAAVMKSLFACRKAIQNLTRKYQDRNTLNDNTWLSGLGAKRITRRFLNITDGQEVSKKNKQKGDQKIPAWNLEAGVRPSDIIKRTEENRQGEGGGRCNRKGGRGETGGGWSGEVRLKGGRVKRGRGGEECAEG